MPDGILDIDSFDKGSKLRQFLRKVFFGNPIVREFRGFVLDVGCGIGLYLEGYSGPSLGIDIHSGNVKVCQEKGINSIVADANSFVREKSFDTVLLEHILEHLIEPSRVLRNTYLNTKVGGRIIIVLPCLFSFLIRFNDLGGHKQFINEQYIDYYLLRMGCKKLKSYTFPFMDLPYFKRYREVRLIYQKGE